ncbi:hypothetical protein JNUCC1_03324 [Lentibacillus sp. JNUCC-1]|uniref:hypothetical protein n=1 Tax=Lentibacillus sp. JNUCC-1 TaxID=2654513 RepID=UPI0012E75F3A|nr:hypothetical protein [Lentibacillus sp. JNUCC-1]MUV39446.1 hypothetical protein [Lentibacillus sp. JNUCC-1]
MCQTCNGTGGLAIEHSWGIQFEPCPDTNCDFEVDNSDLERLQAWLDEQKRRESA